jgi:uroporphyrinogen decarboxylase
MSRKLWKKFFAPHLERLWKLAKSYGLKVQLHSCGSVRELIPDLLEMGLDILDPIQVRAQGMNPAELKKDYGHRLSFHGSMDTQETLPFGSELDVKNEVLERLRTMAPGGGFILSPSQHLLTEIPLRNIITMYETAYEYGFYSVIHKLEKGG